VLVVRGGGRKGGEMVVIGEKEGERERETNVLLSNAVNSLDYRASMVDK